MKRRVKKLSLPLLLPLLALALVAVSLLKPLSTNAAPASKLHLFKLKQQIHSSFDNNLIRKTSRNVTYHGGSVMEGTASVYAIFWEPTGSYVSSTYNSLIERYFRDVGGSSLYHNNTQYRDSSGNAPGGAVLAASWVDTATYPSTTLSDGNIQNEVTHAMQVNQWQAGADNVFFVFTAKGENICISSSTCSFSTFCAYHSSFDTGVIYAALPYAGTDLATCGVSSSPNKDIDADSTIDLTSHEQMESATDPFNTAWFDRAGNEIADKCVWKFGSRNAYGGDVLWGSDAYEVQKEWDNKVGGCVLSGP